MSESWKVLVADDDPSNLDIAATILRRAGHRVVCCADGRAVLEVLHAQSEPVDAVLLDILMPEADGLEVARLLRSHPATRGVPIVCVSALVGPKDIQAGLSAGCDAYVAKPYTRAGLLEALAEAIDRAR